MPLTGRNTSGHRHRASSIKQRVAAAEAHRAHCLVPGCGTPPLQALGKGVGRFCLKHANHLRRHGHPTRASFSGNHLGSYRRAAFEWCEVNHASPYVAHALRIITGLLDRAGPPVDPQGLVGLSVRERARAVWSRLAARELSPLVILSVALGIEAALASDPDPPRDRRYARVQMAKVLNRMAGGAVKRWRSTSGRTHVDVVAFQQSRGLFLIRLGLELERAAEWVVEHHLADVLAHRERRMADWRSGRARPYPVKMANKARKASITLYDDGPPPQANPEATPKEIVELVTEAGASMSVVRF